MLSSVQYSNGDTQSALDSNGSCKKATWRPRFWSICLNHSLVSLLSPLFLAPVSLLFAFYSSIMPSSSLPVHDQGCGRETLVQRNSVGQANHPLGCDIVCQVGRQGEGKEAKEKEDQEKGEKGELDDEGDGKVTWQGSKVSISSLC